MKVAVMNTSKEISGMLKEVLENEGMEVFVVYTYFFKESNPDTFIDLVKLNEPDVILYDIAIPYKENYELLKKLKSSPIVSDTPFILTTTNKKALEEIVEEDTGTFELIGKPYDLKKIIEAVKRKGKL